MHSAFDAAKFERLRERPVTDDLRDVLEMHLMKFAKISFANYEAMQGSSGSRRSAGIGARRFCHASAPGVVVVVGGTGGVSGYGLLLVVVLAVAVTIVSLLYAAEGKSWLEAGGGGTVHVDPLNLLAGVSVDYCVAIKRTDLLFGPIFDGFQECGKASVLLELLEPHILSDKLKFLTPTVLKAFIEHYRSTQQIVAVERCLLHLDTAPYARWLLPRFCLLNACCSRYAPDLCTHCVVSAWFTDPWTRTTSSV